MQIHNAVITGSFSYNGADLSNVTSSNESSASLSTRVTQIEQVYATTGSNSFRATQSITGSLTVTGQIIAQTLNVQQVTSSIVYSSGSNDFGCDLNSRQTFTGSFYQTGSVASFSNCVGIGTLTPNSSLTIRSALPKIELSSTNYAGLYKSFLGTLNSAEGILQFGNNGANYFLIGNTSAGGYLQFRTNVNADYGYGCGLEALTIYCDTSVCFAGPVKLAGAYASCLGLGTTSSPAKYLHIQGTNNFTQGIRFSEAGGAYPHNIYFGSPDSSAACWGLDFQVATGAVTSATVLSLRGNCVASFAGQVCAYSFTATANPVAVEYLIVAGGGGGGWDVGGGGGAGGTLIGSTGLLPGTYPIGIGAGGAGSTAGVPTALTGCRGYSTYAMGLIVLGGGGGGNYAGASGGSGASGGGGAGYGATTFGGIPMVGSGCKGGDSVPAYGTGATGGGGGGATGQGCPSVNANGSCTPGGTGVLTTIIGTSCSFSCGGRGGGDSWGGNAVGPANSGYGGDGAGVGGGSNAGSNGGSGIFVIKALNTNSISFSGGLTVTTCTNLGGYNIYVVTAGAGTMTIS